MAGICKSCGGPTTNTRANSKPGKCFSCEYGAIEEPITSIEEEPTIEERLSDIERRLDRLEAEKSH